MSTFANAQASIASLKLTVVDRSIDDLHPNPRNPRKHSKAQLRKLVDSIRAHSFLVPVLVDGQSQVIAGHARVQAAREIGLRTVPTISLELLSPAQAEAFMLADNRLAEFATWDDQLLGEILFDLSTQKLDFSIETTGFDMGDIDLRIETLPALDRPAAEKKVDRVPEAPIGPPVSQPGDLWQLGRHRVLCGSALDKLSYDTLMGEERAAMVFTDPPYNVPIHGHVSGLGAIRHREFAMASGEMSQEQFRHFLREALSLVAGHSRNGSMHFICMDWRHLWDLMEAADLIYAELKNLCVWAKDNAGMGSLYRSQHELVLVYKHGTAPHRNNVELGRHGRNRTNVWRYPGVNSFGRKGEEGNLLALHPTVKPVQLVADAILDCSARGDVVLDAFLGSGTTLMAAERVGRRCFGLELDPLYVDTIIRRWQAYTGDQARHAVTGASFVETAALALTQGEGT